MAIKKADFIRESTTTTGSGSITLSQQLGWARFSDAFSVGDQVPYIIENGNNRETGIGTIISPNVLSRTTVSTTLVGGVFDNTNPAPISLLGSSLVSCGPIVYTEDSSNITSGTIDNAVIGGTTPAAGNFTTLTTSNGVLEKTTEVSGWKFTGKSVSVTAQDTSPTQVRFSSDGTKMYVIGTTNDSIYQYSLSTPWDVSSTVTLVNTLVLSAHDGTPYTFHFSPDGTYLFVLCSTNKLVKRFTLITAWNLASISGGLATPTADAGTYNTTVPESGNMIGMFFKPDGSKMWLHGDTNNRLYQYTLGTAWDLSTVTEDTYMSGLSYTVVTNVVTVTAPNHGFVVGDGVDIKFTTGTATPGELYTIATVPDANTFTFALTTADTSGLCSILKGFNTANWDTATYGLWIDSTGYKLYLVGSTYERIVELRLNNAWDIGVRGSTLTDPNWIQYISNKGFNLQYDNYVTNGTIEPGSLGGLCIEESQNKAWIIGTTLDRVVELSMLPTSPIKWTSDTLTIKAQTHVDGSLNIHGSVLMQGNMLNASTITYNAITGSTLTASSTVTLSATTAAINIGTSLTSGVLTIGGTSTTSTTVFGRSTATNTIGIATGATANAATQTINIGSGAAVSGGIKTITIGGSGASGSTTNITIGNAVSGGLGSTVIHGVSQLAYNAAAPTIASATTIAPTTMVTFISGTTTINTITAPGTIATKGGTLILIPTGLWSTGTSGNIAIATTAVVSKALHLTYDPTTTKWYPSY